MARLGLSSPVQELIWFAAGAVATGSIAWLRSIQLARRRGVRPPGKCVEGRVQAVDDQGENAAGSPHHEPRRRQERTPVPTGLDARVMARSLAEELANLASGVEGRAHLLIEAAPDRRALPQAAEGMLRAVHRLRTLHRKIVAFALDRIAAPGRTELGDVVAELAEDLQQLQLGLELHWHPPATLPPIAVASGVVRDALLFLTAAMIRAERGATRLTLAGEVPLGDRPMLKIELSLEWIEENVGRHRGAGFERGRIDFEAAANLVRAQGGTIELTHMPGRVVRALVRLPAASREAPEPRDDAPAPVPEGMPAPAEPIPLAAGAEHQFGGALLLETDPTVRAMVARELKASGRAVFACADTASVRAFLTTAPERFELLVVDSVRRISRDETLSESIRMQAPELKIFVLDGRGGELADRFAHLHCIPKPFGVLELREALALVLAAK